MALLFLNNTLVSCIVNAKKLTRVIIVNISLYAQTTVQVRVYARQAIHVLASQALQKMIAH